MPERPCMIDPKTVIELTFTAYMHDLWPLSHICLLWTKKLYQHLETVSEILACVFPGLASLQSIPFLFHHHLFSLPLDFVRASVLTWSVLESLQPCALAHWGLSYNIHFILSSAKRILKGRRNSSLHNCNVTSCRRSDSSLPKPALPSIYLYCFASHLRFSCLHDFLTTPLPTHPSPPHT